MLTTASEVIPDAVQLDVPATNGAADGATRTSV